MKKNNFGISLISLIITIIVIIILAAIVIFTGLGTADEANFAKFVSEFSDFNLAVDNAYMKKYADYAVKNQTRSKAQIYYEIATGIDVGMNGEPKADDTLESLNIKTWPSDIEGTNCYRVTSDKNVYNWDKEKTYYAENEVHYITDEGEAFTLPGYLVTENDGTEKWWVNERKYYIGNQVVPEAYLAMQYEVVHKNGYSIIKLYPQIKESETYGDYAAKILYGKTDEEIEQMFVEGHNWWNEKEDGEIFNDINELLVYYDSDNDFYKIESVESLCNYYGMNSLAELAINWKCIEPEAYDFTVEDVEKNYSIYNENDDKTIDSSTTICPYSEYYCYTSGSYNFTLKFGGENVNVNVYIEVEEANYENMFITDGNGTILGMNEEFFVALDVCYSQSKIPYINIPEKIGSEVITAIGENAFLFMLGIEKIILPSSLTNIGYGAFRYCNDLISVEIPSSVASIGDRAFEECENLISIKFPNSITSIGSLAFRFCDNLTTITIESGSTLTVPSNKWGATNATIVYE